MAKKSKTDNQPPNTRGRADHLKQYQWKPGQPSPNPPGRPKGKLPSEIMRDMLQAEYGGPEAIKRLQQDMPEPWRSKKFDTLTAQEIIGWIQIRRAMQPTADTARRDLYDRAEGKPKMRIEGPDGGPVELSLNLKNLSDDELDLWMKLLSKAEGSK